ncbi:MAG: ArsA family ATPase [Nocardioidaceae bacterium]|nr:ArsA family ATPase [Nocardioidaceae bacterium]
MRVLLFTGKGGVGKSTIAAGTAATCASAGHRTLVLSTDTAHSLADAFGTPVGAEPTEVADRLLVQQVDAQLRFQQSWAEIQRYLLSVLDVAGVDPVAAEELTVIPGAEEVLALLELRLHARSGRWDVIIVDCAPTAETLRLLSFPDVCTWWLEKVFPFQSRVVAAVGPLARTLIPDLPLPGEAVFKDVERLARNLVAMNDILRDRRHTTVRLVMNADRMVVKEAMRTFTYLNLYGYLTDAVVVNRMFGEEAAEGYFAGWRERQQEHMELVRSGFSPVPILTAPYYPREVVGPEMLDRLGEDLFEGIEAHGVLHEQLSQGLSSENGRATLRLVLPFAERGEIGLKKVGLEVIVRVGAQKRTIMLPPAMAAYDTSGARFEDGALEVYFARVIDGVIPPDKS